MITRSRTSLSRRPIAAGSPRTRPSVRAGSIAVVARIRVSRLASRTDSASPWLRRTKNAPIPTSMRASRPDTANCRTGRETIRGWYEATGWPVLGGPAFLLKPLPTPTRKARTHVLSHIAAEERVHEEDPAQAGAPQAEPQAGEDSALPHAGARGSGRLA